MRPAPIVWGAPIGLASRTRRVRATGARSARAGPSRGFLALAVAALAAAACGRGATTGDAEPLDALLREAVEAGQVPGVVAAAATAERVVYQGAVRLPPDAIAAISWMTAPITAVAVLQLVESGRVALDEPAHTYLPELRDVQVLDSGRLRAPASAPTVRQLLTHTSGFAHEMFDHDIAGLVRAGTVESSRTGTDVFLRAPLVADPGARWEFGIGSDWLGRLIERVSGRSLDAYLQAEIFEPLGMVDTFFVVPPEKRGRVAPLWVRQADAGLAVLPPPTFAPPGFLSGASGLYSTAGDYLRFARALLAGGALDGRRILRDETVAAMGTHQIAELPFLSMTPLDPRLVAPEVVLPGGLDGFGLGVALNRRPLASGRGAGSLSWAGLFNTYFWVDRERGIAAVLLAQVLPFGDEGPAELAEEFDRQVYLFALVGSRQ